MEQFMELKDFFPVVPWLKGFCYDRENIGMMNRILCGHVRTLHEHPVGRQL